MQWRVDVCPIWPLFQSDVSVAGSTFAHGGANRSMKREVWVLLQYLSFWWLLPWFLMVVFSSFWFSLVCKNFFPSLHVGVLCLRMCQLSLFTRVTGVIWYTREDFWSVCKILIYLVHLSEWTMAVKGKPVNPRRIPALQRVLWTDCQLLFPTIYWSAQGVVIVVWEVKIQLWCGFWSVKEGRK